MVFPLSLGCASRAYRVAGTVAGGVRATRYDRTVRSTWAVSSAWRAGLGSLSSGIVLRQPCSPNRSRAAVLYTKAAAWGVGVQAEVNPLPGEPDADLIFAGGGVAGDAFQPGRGVAAERHVHHVGAVIDDAEVSPRVVKTVAVAVIDFAGVLVQRVEAHDFAVHEHVGLPSVDVEAPVGVAFFAHRVSAALRG
jgi:hypothetical protein